MSYVTSEEVCLGLFVCLLCLVGFFWLLLGLCFFGFLVGGWLGVFPLLYFRQNETCQCHLEFLQILYLEL